MIDYTDKRLEGSALFFQGSSPFSWLVRIGGLFTPKYGFTLSKFSHVETIFFNDKDGQLYTIGALQPVVRIKPLKEVIEERAKEHKEIVKLSDFEYKDMQRHRAEFLHAIEINEGEQYGFISAFSSEIDPLIDGTALNKLVNKLKPRKQIHCSALDAYLLQTTRVISRIIPALEYTPDDCYYTRIDLASTVETV